MEHDFEVMKLCVVGYLAHVRTANERMEELVSRIRMVEARLTASGMSVDGMPGSPNAYRDAIPDGIIALFELREELATRVVECTEEYSHAADICSPDHPCRRAVWLHVVEERTWAHVGRKLGYSEHHVRKALAHDGIAQIYREMPERYRREPIPNAAPL